MQSTEREPDWDSIEDAKLREALQGLWAIFSKPRPVQKFTRYDIVIGADGRVTWVQDEWDRLIDETWREVFGPEPDEDAAT
jgi:hypothetical protein